VLNGFTVGLATLDCWAAGLSLLITANNLRLNSGVFGCVGLYLTKLAITCGSVLFSTCAAVYLDCAVEKNGTKKTRIYRYLFIKTMIYRSLNFTNNGELFFLVCAKFIIFATLKIKDKLINF
jgi:hypothetical protein